MTTATSGRWACSSCRCWSALQAIPAFNPGVEDRADVLQGPLFGIHVSSLLFAYASFALACVIGITYVLLFKEIKAKHLGFFYARLPSLQVLDRMNQRRDRHRLDLPDHRHHRRRDLGGAGRGGYSAGDPRVQAMSLQDPEDFRRAGLLAGLLVRAVRGAAHRLGRTARRLSVGGGVPDRALQLRPDQLLSSRRVTTSDARCSCS